MYGVVAGQKQGREMARTPQHKEQTPENKAVSKKLSIRERLMAYVRRRLNPPADAASIPEAVERDTIISLKNVMITPFRFTTKMKTSILAIYVILLVQCEAQIESVLANLTQETLTEDGKLNFTQLTRKYGHESEEHEIITEDGYILTMFHTPGDKPPVLLLHGMIDSADTYAIRGNISMLITLADAGYDVWIGNCRGNKYGRRHVKLDPDEDLDFWDFSWHEIGYYDVSAMIDYVRTRKGDKRISVIGHSQGSTAMLVLASMRPEYNSRIEVFIALGPGAFYNNVKPPFSLLLESGPALDAIVPQDIQEIFQDHRIMTNFIRFICSRGVVGYHLCTFGLNFFVAGADRYGIEPDFLRTLIGHCPAGASRRTLMHYDQLYFRKSFGRYDFGSTKNLAKYGSSEPPDYDLSAVTMKVALIVGKNDQITTAKDTELLKDRLPNVVLHKILKPKRWNHLDYIWSVQMPKYLYPSIFELLEQYNNVDSEDQKSIYEEENDLNVGHNKAIF